MQPLPSRCPWRGHLLSRHLSSPNCKIKAASSASRVKRREGYGQQPRHETRGWCYQHLSVACALCRFWCWTEWLYFSLRRKVPLIALDLYLSYKTPSLICNLETELNMLFIRNYRHNQVHKKYNLSPFSPKVSATELSAQPLREREV